MQNNFEISAIASFKNHTKEKSINSIASKTGIDRRVISDWIVSAPKILEARNKRKRFALESNE